MGARGNVLPEVGEQDPQQRGGPRPEYSLSSSRPHKRSRRAIAMRIRLILSLISFAVVLFLMWGIGAAAINAQPAQGADWPLLDQNPQRTNYSPETIISEGNAASLHELWHRSINR